ncbi:MAG: TIGR04283 family arsenosugar biosynthesis glycosyltransferase [Vulcanococcus sp.]
MAAPRLSVLIPARNEARRLPLLLADLAAAPALVQEVVVVDGGSRDATPDLVRLAGARLLDSAPGRGLQLRLGAAHCEGDWLLVLHADGRLSPGWREAVAQAMADTRPGAWCFPLRVVADLQGQRAPGPLFLVLGWLVGLRSRWLQRPYGDQGLLVPMALYRAVGGFRPLPLMEDLDLVQRLARCGRLRMLAGGLLVDGRRWLGLGLLRTALSNAGLRRAWQRGVAPEVLARYYRAPLAFRRRTRKRSAARWVPAPSPGSGRTPPLPDRRTG